MWLFFPDQNLANVKTVGLRLVSCPERTALFLLLSA